MSRLLIGAVAGSVGTIALDTTTYLDMALRGRAPSEMTRTLVQKLAGKLGIDGLATDRPDERTKNRQDAIGALMGYGLGKSVGIVYALIKPPVNPVLGGVIAGAVAMAVTDGSAVALGATDISTWDAAAWLSDLIPHALYGLTVALMVEALST